MNRAQSQPEKGETSPSEKPRTRTAATKPEDTKHLTENEEQALELGEEAQHAIGAQREELTKKASRQADNSQRGA